jgi:DNA-binding response OmpR family regulator
LATIVLADDDADLRDLYTAFLRASGHQVWPAADGSAALALVRAHRPAFLLLDIWMPALNGFEVLDALRHDPAGTRLHVVVISALGDAEARLRAFEGGATDYVVKGTSLAELRNRLEGLLAAS